MRKSKQQVMKKLHYPLLALLTTLMLFPAEAQGKSVRKIIEKYRNESKVLYVDTAERPEEQMVSITLEFIEDVHGGTATYKRTISVNRAFTEEGLENKACILLTRCSEDVTEKFFRKIDKALENYQHMTEINVDYMKAEVYIKQNRKGNISELVIVQKHAEEVTCMYGDMPVSVLDDIFN